jgi:chorismate mutase/prephenate dehydratase
MSLQEHRQAIDRLDEQIVSLLNERTRHVLEIGQIKIKAGEEIYAPHRERAVLERVVRKNKGPITHDSLRAIYREVMSSALSLEKTLTIAYLGPEATFTHQAAIKRFGSSLTYAPQKTIGEVFSEVSKHRADYGVVPVENSTEGVVTHTLDMFVDSDLKIVAQVVLRISHCLAGKGAKDTIRRLYVHPQTLAQCRGWIQRNLPHAELIETSSNARSAELAAKEKRSAALCGELAATQYGVPILERDLQDNAANATGGAGSDQHHVQHSRRGRCPPQGARSVPQVPDQHDEDRVPPEQASGLGILLLCRCGRPRGAAEGGQGDRAAGPAVQLREGARQLSERGVGGGEVES